MFADSPVQVTALAVTALGAAAAGWLTARRALAAELAATRYAATHDPLTGIYNRAGLTAASDALISAGHAAGGLVVVLLVDLVGFKAVNDTYGHDAGDAVLTTVAGRLATIAEPAGIAARLGGDEFAAVVTAGPNRRHDDVSQWLTQLHAHLTIPVSYGGQPLPVGATIGASLARPHLPVGAWLTAADKAMYAARAHRTATAITSTPHPPESRPAVRSRDKERPTSHLAAIRPRIA